MRKIFAETIERLVLSHEKIIFITGDLGYNAFENLEEKLGHWFINAGVAEQNMIGVAAGLAYKGYKVFCYSIAPFATYRCLEQIRIDVCFHQLPVFIVGNGGGYGYGIMGATHHALEDIACMSSLPNMTCYIPAFAGDVSSSIADMIRIAKPSYLRLGLAKRNPYQQLSFESINTLSTSADSKITMLVMGPVINNATDAIIQLQATTHVDLFSVTKIPVPEIAGDLLQSLRRTKKLLIIEEHVARGGMAEHISLKLHGDGIALEKFRSLNALGYPDGLHGDQSYYQAQSGLDSKSIQTVIREWLG